MAVKTDAPLHPDNLQHVPSAISSPISQNPLLRRDAPTGDQTPSPSHRRPQIFRTQDGNAAWAAAEGLFPIREGFSAPGYVPAHLVGGVRYAVRSPMALSPQNLQSNVQRASVGRQLFAEYTVPAANGVDLQQAAPQSYRTQQAAVTAPQSSCMQQQETAIPPVRHYEPNYMRIY
jgi:hypothetical protein